MAAKKRGKTALDSFERFDVRVAILDPVVKQRALRGLATLERGRFLDPLFSLVSRERGAWLRQGQTWSEVSRNHAERAFRRAELLESIVREQSILRGWEVDSPSEVAEPVDAVREASWAAFWESVCLLEEHVGSGEWTAPTESQALAGLSGSQRLLETFRADSAVEAIGSLSWCFRRALLGMAAPFWPFLDDADSEVVNRESPSGLMADEVEVLRMCHDACKPLMSAEVVYASSQTGSGFSKSTADRRKVSLKELGLLADTSQFELTEKGREWLREIDVGVDQRRS